MFNLWFLSKVPRWLSKHQTTCIWLTASTWTLTTDQRGDAGGYSSRFLFALRHVAAICFHWQEIAPFGKSQYSNSTQNVPLSRDPSVGLPVNMTWTDTNLLFYPLVLRDEWGNWFPHPSLNARLPTFSQTWKPRNQFPSLVVCRNVGGGGGFFGSG